jgi:predicted transport protein
MPFLRLGGYGYHSICRLLTWRTPKGICKDVSNFGRWGNGDVEVGLSAVDEMPYVMSLVRQSFEQPMSHDPV